MDGGAGVVYWLRAEPSDASALTDQEIECLKRAQVMVHGEFAVDAFLALVDDGCEVVSLGQAKRPLSAAEVADLLVERAIQGKSVVRVHGSAGEWDALVQLGVQFESVAGSEGRILGASLELALGTNSDKFAEGRTATTPLLGRRLLLSRGANKAGKYAAELEKLGATIAYARCTELVSATQEESEVAALALQEIQNVDWLFFSSANAIRYFFALAKSLNMDNRQFDGRKIAVVGEASAQALSEHGFSAALVASGKSGAELAQALVDLLGERGPGTRVLFPRAREGREEPGRLLQESGLLCQVLVVYASRPIFPPDPPLLETLGRLEKGEIDGALFFAPSQWHALIGVNPSVKSQVANLPVVAAIGETTAAAIEAVGITVQVVPAIPNPRQLAVAIADAFLR